MSKARDLANLLGGGTSGAITFGGTAAIRVPNGTTEQRPTPAAGMIRYNTTTGFAEVYDGNQWADFGAPPPSISTVTPSTYNGESGTTFTINGANFTADATVYFITSGGTEVQAGTVSFVNGAQLTATTPQDFTVADEPLDVKVVQVSGVVTKLSVIDCGGVPTWVTASGQLGATAFKDSAFSETVEATDPDANSSIIYSLSSGALPSGISLNTTTGVISGTAPSVSSDTTYNFQLAATDNAGNSTARAFSIIIVNPEAEATGGLGYKTAYSDATNAIGVTNTSMTLHLLNADDSVGNPTQLFNYSIANFTWHTGHSGNPTYGAVQITSGTPRVLNQIEWKAHQNGVGNVDIFGSNKAITSSNFTTLANWSHLGRVHFGGASGSSEGQNRALSFNPNGYGYRWYLIFARDNSSSALSYPNVSSMGGYAMYGARLNKV